ncbi:MAG: hypothetical protein RLZZ450_6953 [Pseudomonadota bacterium]|jgi:hypothetical protein
MGDNKGLQVVLSLFFKAVVGIPRIFHFETLDDPGFAILSGGKRVLSRHMLGGLVRRVPLAGVRRLMKLTAPSVQRAKRHTISIDEHAVAKFTRKFSIRKGYHTIRNKHMKIEKLTFAFHTGARKLLSLIATPGHVGLKDIAEKLLPSLRRRARGAQLRIVLDAGAAKSHGQLLALADHKLQVTIVRVPRRPAYRKQWQQLSSDQWHEHHEEGPYKAAPPKVVHVANTVMTLRDPQTKTQCHVRTIVVREKKAKRGKERWHALWVFGDDHSDSWQIVEEFRTRQHHEQTYRVLLHDAHIDTVCSGYNKRSPNPARPGFKQNAITLYSWTAALATHALASFATTLPHAFRRAHPRTLRRWFLNTPADIFLGQGTLIVALQPRCMHDTWKRLVDHLNRGAFRIPWLDQRRLVMSLDRQSLSEVRKLDLIRRRGR